MSLTSVDPVVSLYTHTCYQNREEFYPLTDESPQFKLSCSKHRCFYNATWSTSSYLHVWACFYEARLLYITTMYMYHVLLYACVRFVHTRRLCHVHQFAYCNSCRTHWSTAYRVMHDVDWLPMSMCTLYLEFWGCLLPLADRGLHVLIVASFHYLVQSARMVSDYTIYD